MRSALKILLVFACAIFAFASARADAAPPTHLRPCQDGEDGVVLSRYHRVDGYAVLHPYVAGTLIVAYFSDGRFHSDPLAAVFNPAIDAEPGPAMRLPSSAALGPVVATREPSEAPRESSPSDLPRP